MPELTFAAGINEQSKSAIDINECTSGFNFLLDPDSSSFRRRPTQDLLGSSPTTSSVTGIIQLIKQDDTETTLVMQDTQVYEWDGASVFSSVGTVTSGGKFRSVVFPIDDVAIIVDRNKVNVVKEWTGSTFSDYTHNIAGVTSLYAAYAEVFNDRLVLANVKTDSTDYPHVILFSAFDDYDNHGSPSTSSDGGTSRGGSKTGNEAFWLTTPDLRPVNGVAVVAGAMIISTDGGQLFKLTGSDASDYRFEPFYTRSHAVGVDSLVSMGTDAIYLKSGGRYELVSAAERFGDLTADDVGRFIKTLSNGLTDALGVYDQAHQRVYFFVSGEVHVYDKNFAVQSQLSPWSRWRTLMSSLFNTNAAEYLRVPGGTDWTVYWGDSSGNIYDINGTGTSGDGGSVSIQAKRTSRLVSNMDTINEIISGAVEYKRRGVCDLEVGIEWAGTYANRTSLIPLKGPLSTTNNESYFNNEAYFGAQCDPHQESCAEQDAYFNGGATSSEEFSYASFSAPTKGPSFLVSVTISDTVDYFVNRIIV